MMLAYEKKCQKTNSFMMICLHYQESETNCVFHTGHGWGKRQEERENLKL